MSESVLETVDDWHSLVLDFLAERIVDAPDGTCQALARGLWNNAAEMARCGETVSTQEQPSA
jgi:hypothetical protein